MRPKVKGAGACSAVVAAWFVSLMLFALGSAPTGENQGTKEAEPNRTTRDQLKRSLADPALLNYFFADVEHNLYAGPQTLCGPTALYAVLHKLGRQPRLVELLELLPFDPAQGTTFDWIAETVRTIGLSASAYELNGNAIVHILRERSDVGIIVEVFEGHVVAALGLVDGALDVLDYPRRRSVEPDRLTFDGPRPCLVVSAGPSKPKPLISSAPPWQRLIGLCLLFMGIGGGGVLLLRKLVGRRSAALPVVDRQE